MGHSISSLMMSDKTSLIFWDWWYKFRHILFLTSFQSAIPVANQQKIAYITCFVKFPLVREENEYWLIIFSNYNGEFVILSIQNKENVML